MARNVWHRLGDDITDFGMDSATNLMKDLDLYGWNARKQPIYAYDQQNDSYSLVKGRAAVVRDDKDGQPFAVGDVGARYGVVQNEAYADVLDILREETGARVETGGVMNDGAKMFLSMKLPERISIGGEDPVDQYLTMFNSHDGSTPLMLFVSPIRVACQNVVNLAFERATNRIRIQHKAKAQDRIEESRQITDKILSYYREFTDRADRLADIDMTNNKFEEIISKEFYPQSADAPQVARDQAEKKVGTIMELFTAAQTQDNIRGTAWAGFGALTEWYEHYSPVQGASNYVRRRSERAITDSAFYRKSYNLMAGV